MKGSLAGTRPATFSRRGPYSGQESKPCHNPAAKFRTIPGFAADRMQARRMTPPGGRTERQRAEPDRLICDAGAGNGLPGEEAAPESRFGKLCGRPPNELERNWIDHPFGCERTAVDA
jgi:hypothetical protein